MKTKKIISAIMSVCMAVSCIIPFQASADWELDEENGDAYYIVNGIAKKDCIYYVREDGLAYRFDKNGVCVSEYSGWIRQKSDKSQSRYYDHGKRLCGWQYINDMYYYFDFETGNCCNKDEGVKQPLKLTGKIKYDENNNQLLKINVKNTAVYTFPVGHNGFSVEQQCGNSFNPFDVVYSVELPNTTYWLDSESSRTFTLSMTDLYGNLPKGTYRIQYGYNYSEPFTVE